MIHKTAKQTMFLFLSQIFGLGASFFITMYLAKEMGAKDFGIYSFSIAVIGFLAIFFEFGYFASSSRLLAKNRNKDIEKKLLGASFFIFTVIATLFIITIFMLSLLVDNIFKDKIGSILRTSAIASWSFLIPFYLELILKGTNHIELLSIFNFVWKILFAIFIISISYLNLLEPLNVIYAFSLSCILSFIFIFLKLNVSFRSLKIFIIKIYKEFLTYGRHIYIGRILDTSTYQLDRLMIGYFSGAKEVGFYSLSNSIANPINLFSFSLASSKFKEFSNHKPISKNLLIVNTFWILISVLGINTLNYIMVKYYLGNEYNILLVLTFIMSLTVGFNAAFQPYNFWLDANGYSKLLKRKAYYTSLANIVLNFLLIPFYGAVGATIASLISMKLSFFLHIFYYKNVLRRS